MATHMKGAVEFTPATIYKSERYHVHVLMQSAPIEGLLHKPALTSL